MKFVVYGTERRLGVVDSASVVDVANGYRRYSGEVGGDRGISELPSGLRQFIEGGRAFLDATEMMLAHFHETAPEPDALSDPVRQPLDEVRLMAPFPGARVACAGSNYAQHSAGMARARGDDLGASPEEAVRARGMWGFWKLTDPLGPDGIVQYPRANKQLDYEGEAAIVLGKHGSRLKPNDVDAMVWGVTLVIDWSLRDLREIPNSSFALGKNFDTSLSVGPCIVVDEVAPDAVHVSTHVNGELRQDFDSSMMVFSFGEYLEYLSREMTLIPGDIISGGTGAGTALDSSRNEGHGSGGVDWFLHPGDRVEVVSPEIGKLAAEIVSQD